MGGGSGGKEPEEGLVGLGGKRGLKWEGKECGNRGMEMKGEGGMEVKGTGGRGGGFEREEEEEEDDDAVLGVAGVAVVVEAESESGLTTSLTACSVALGSKGNRVKKSRDCGRTPSVGLMYFSMT